MNQPEIALVYQGGIANVFAVDAGGNRVRLLQHGFEPCYWFCKGLANAGKRVRTYSCNRAGDIITAAWTEGLDDCPFRDNAKPVHAN